MTTTPDPTVPAGDDPLVTELVETLETWALVAPPALPVNPDTERRPPRTWALALVAAAGVVFLMVGIGVVVNREGGRHAAATRSSHSDSATRADHYAGCGDEVTPLSDGPPAIELRLTAPSRATSGAMIPVQVQARSRDGKAHDLVTGLDRGLVWVRDGRILGREGGPMPAMAVGHQVAADGSWTTLTWGDPTATLQSELVGAGSRMLDNGSARDPLAPGRYDLVVALTDLGSGGSDRRPTYVSHPVPVEVVAPAPDAPAIVTLIVDLPKPDADPHPAGAVRVEADGRLVREVPLTSGRMTLTLPGGTYRFLWSRNRSCVTTLSVAPGQADAWAVLDCPKARPTSP